LLYKLKNIESM